mmetsp:Transcript_17366/g.35809  ORF Transcript_17366/g.35809 Transcript_17366/m.35809 type:complete len:212 (-) Transcript_17366:5863-6498(-)
MWSLVFARLLFVTDTSLMLSTELSRKAFISETLASTGIPTEGLLPLNDTVMFPLTNSRPSTPTVVQAYAPEPESLLPSTSKLGILYFSCLSASLNLLKVIFHLLPSPKTSFSKLYLFPTDTASTAPAPRPKSFSTAFLKASAVAFADRSLETNPLFGFLTFQKPSMKVLSLSILGWLTPPPVPVTELSSILKVEIYGSPMSVLSKKVIVHS